MTGMLQGGWSSVTLAVVGVLVVGVVVPLVVIVAALAWTRGMESVARRPRWMAVLFTVLTGLYVVLTAVYAGETGATLRTGLYALCALVWAIASAVQWRKAGGPQQRQI